MKRSITLLALLAILAQPFFSCQKLLIGNTVKNTPTANFDEMWKGYHQWYGMFSVRQVNWDSLYIVYRPMVNDQMSNTELYGILCRLITPLNDIHAFLQPTSDGLPRFESSDFFRINRIQRDFSIDLVRSKYIPSLVTVDSSFHYGITPDNIGYIHFGEFGLPLSFYKQQLNVIMESLKDTKGIIIDIRNHAGGDDEVSRYIAGLFAVEEKLYMTVRKRNGVDPGCFTSPESWFVKPSGNSSYVKPVVLLTTRWTSSAGETFTWAMNTQSQVTQMGDTTAGGFTDVISRELPNGWLYFVGVGDYRNALGNSEEGIGVSPKKYIINTREDIEEGNDKVLEAAMASF
ncbi:S41 family peptidase [Flavihumibacter profundi]|uniref:S41 family peptidase n=1 Tax=Flavihumibacter profundi TaxID=2716883 RepID=UPI001CC7C7FE|nr:S41 family peptidase [Flavihumibacter profundi]MBZ5855964.1 S41 family peptidase [Flavihumibacter profundi]